MWRDTAYYDKKHKNNLVTVSFPIHTVFCSTSKAQGKKAFCAVSCRFPLDITKKILLFLITFSEQNYPWENKCVKIIIRPRENAFHLCLCNELSLLSFATLQTVMWKDPSLIPADWALGRYFRVSNKWQIMSRKGQFLVEFLLNLLKERETSIGNPSSKNIYSDSQHLLWWYRAIDLLKQFSNCAFE